MGNWDRSLGAAPLLSSKLTHIISGASLANSFRHFNLSYADTGLWGVHIVTENVRTLLSLPVKRETTKLTFPSFLLPFPASSVSYRS